MNAINVLFVVTSMYMCRTHIEKCYFMNDCIIKKHSTVHFARLLP